MEQIVEKTDGVPLFVEEITKTVLESEVLKEANGQYELVGTISSLAIPSTLQWDVTDSSAVARAAVALLSDWFPATSGSMIHVDGGFHAVGA